MNDSDGSTDQVTLWLGATLAITLRPGSAVLVEESAGVTYGAVIVRIKDCYADLTFTPPDKPRTIPLGLIVCSLGDESATMDLSSIPEYQPTPNVAPYRRRVKANV